MNVGKSRDHLVSMLCVLIVFSGNIKPNSEPVSNKTHRSCQSPSVFIKLPGIIGRSFSFRNPLITSHLPSQRRWSRLNIFGCRGFSCVLSKSRLMARLWSWRSLAEPCRHELTALHTTWRPGGGRLCRSPRRSQVDNRRRAGPRSGAIGVGICEIGWLEFFVPEVLEYRFGHAQLLIGKDSERTWPRGSIMSWSRLPRALLALGSVRRGMVFVELFGSQWELRWSIPSGGRTSPAGCHRSKVSLGVTVLGFVMSGGMALRRPSGGLDPSASLGMTCVGARDDVLVARIDMKGSESLRPCEGRTR